MVQTEDVVEKNMTIIKNGFDHTALKLSVKVHILLRTLAEVLRRCFHCCRNNNTN